MSETRRITKALLNRKVLRRGNVAGVANDDLLTLMSSIRAMSERFPDAFSLNPIIIDARPADNDPAVPSVAYVPGSASGHLEVRKERELSTDDVRRELIRHLYRQLTPSAQAWLWKKVRTENNLPDEPGVYVTSVQVSEAMEDPSPEWQGQPAYTSAVTREDLAVRTLRFEPEPELESDFEPQSTVGARVGRSFLDGFDALLGPRSMERDDIRRAIGTVTRPLQGPASGLLMRRSQAPTQSAKGMIDLATTDDTTVRYVQTTNGRNFRVSNVSTIDIDESLRTHSIVSLPIGTVRSDHLQAGASFPLPGSDALPTVALCYTVDLSNRRARPFDKRPVDGRFKIAERAIVAMLVRTARDAGADVRATHGQLVISRPHNGYTFGTPRIPNLGATKTQKAASPPDHAGLDPMANLLAGWASAIREPFRKSDGFVNRSQIDLEPGTKATVVTALPAAVLTETVNDPTSSLYDAIGAFSRATWASEPEHGR